MFAIFGCSTVGSRQQFGLRSRPLAKVNRVLLCITIILVVVAIVSAIAMLAKDAGMGLLRGLPRGVDSAIPLLLVGLALLIVQLMIRPRFKELLKNVLLAAAFILWGVVQLMPQNTLSMKLGNLVVALYVLDLAWDILGRLNPLSKRGRFAGTSAGPLTPPSVVPESQRTQRLTN